MEKELIFQILGIPETKDEEDIRRSYREKLKETNPEDDPEGFKRLRQAYEEAIKLLHSQPKEEDRGGPKDEVDLWVDQVEELYQDLLRRGEPELWKKVLSDSVCEGLDTSLEARDKIIVFLMDHVHLPHEIWKMIDSVFEVTADIQSLKEKYPINFLNYMKYYVENETFIPFGLFSYRDGGDKEKANGDGYIDEYLQIKRQIDNGEREGCLQRLHDLSAFGIYHPYEDVERLRIFAEEGKEDQELAEGLLERYKDDVYIRLHVGNSFWAAGSKERAYELWKEILEQMPDHYTAKYFCVKHLMDQEDYYQARKYLLELLDIDDRSEELRSYIHRANEALIEELKDAVREGREDERFPGDELRLTLGWCLLQNERREEALQIVEGFEPEPGQEYGYVNLYSQLLYFSEQYEEAVPYLKKWMELVENLTDDGTDETKKRMARKPRIHLLLSSCYYELENEEWEKEGELSIDTASGQRERIENMHYFANKLLLTKKYGSSVDICDRLLAEDESYYPAYLIRQEACYYMKKAQQVVDDYHKAVDIYAGYHRPYLFAAKICFNYSQYEDAKNVIEYARENQVEFSDEMKLYEAKVLRNLSNNKDDRKRPREILEELSGKLKEENSDLEDCSEIAFERGLICWDDNEFENALIFMEDAIRQNPDRMQYRIVRGHIYLEMEKYKEALEEYRISAKDYEDSPELYYNRGCAYEGLEETELAIADFKKTLELDDKYRNTNHKLYDIYKRKFNSKNHKEDYKQALYYINRRLEIRKTANAYFYRAMLYSDAMEVELALKDYEKYLAEVPDDKAMFFNVGLCYRAIRQFEKAIEYFKKAKELKPDSDTFYEIGVCYKAIGRYEEALETLKEGAEVYPKDADLWKQIGHVYEKKKDYDKARDAFNKMKHFSADCSDAENEIAATWIMAGKFRKGLGVLSDAIRKAPENEKASLYSHLADKYYDREEFKKAEKYYLKAIACEKDPFELFDYERYLAMVYYRMDRHEEAKKYAQASIDHFHESGRTQEDYIGYKAYSPVRLGIFGWLYLCLGDTEKAKESFREMERMQPCKFCAYGKCFESSLYLAQFYESQGDIKKAIEMMEETLRRNPDNLEAKLNLENLRRKL